MAAGSDNLKSLTKQLNAFVTSIQQQGVLNEFFYITYKLKYASNNPSFFIETASAFCSDTTKLLSHLHLAVSLPVLDEYRCISEYHIKLKGSSSSLGLCGMIAGCAELAKAISDKSSLKCALAVERLNVEFQMVKEIMSIILDLERRIVACELGGS